jgi:hypothetical protein
MLEDIRDHDPEPTPEEREWLATGVLAAVERVMLLAGIALVIGSTASWLTDYQDGAAFVVTAPAASR